MRSIRSWGSGCSIVSEGPARVGWSCAPRTSALTATAIRMGSPARHPARGADRRGRRRLDAMTTAVLPRGAVVEVALAELSANAGTQFDPAVVDALVAVAVA